MVMGINAWKALQILVMIVGKSVIQFFSATKAEKKDYRSNFLPMEHTFLSCKETIYRGLNLSLKELEDC
jgi:hypothetical protein